MPVDVTESNFYDVISSVEGVAIIDFWAPWCGPCKMLSPRLDELESELKNLTVIKVNVDENGGLARDYNVMSIPTMVLIKDDEVKNVIVGVQSKKVLTEAVESA